MKHALTSHLQETRGHVSRLEHILNQVKGSVDSNECKGIAALITEGEDIIIKDAVDPSLRDAGIIAAAQKVEHHEMAAHGTPRTFAEILADRTQAPLLERTLKEEKRAEGNFQFGERQSRASSLTRLKK